MGQPAPSQTVVSSAPQGRGDKEGGEGASPLDREELWEAYGRKTNSQRAVADKRLAALDTVVALVASGVGKSRAIEQVAEETGINRATLYRWYERVRAHHRTEWAALLLPRHTGNRTSAECSPEAWDYFKADYLSLEQPASTACYSRLKALAAERGWTTPSLATLQRRIRSEIAPQTRVLLRQGEHALMRLYPSLERSVGELHALEWINGDGYRHNVFVRWPDGTIARPVTWLWQDIYSRKILAWRTDHTENSDLIRLALADLIEHWGVPEHATLDNTRAAANKWLSGGTPTRYRFKVRPEDPLGILPRLGIQVHWTSVQAGKGWGQAKPIERAFGVGGLSEYIDKDPAFRGAWTGPDPTAKPENYNSRAVDLQTFEAVLADRLAVWNSQPGRRTEICQGRLSFDEAFSASYSRSTIRKASSAQRRLLLLAAESVRVDNTGAVALDFGVGQAGRGGRNRYADEALLAYSDSGQKVVVRFDPAHLHEAVEVETLDGQHVATAACIQAAGFGDSEAARAHSQARKQFARATKKAAAAQVRADALAVDIPAAAESPKPQPAAIRLMKGRVGAGGPVRRSGRSALKPAPTEDDEAEDSFTKTFLRMVPKKSTREEDEDGES